MSDYRFLGCDNSLQNSRVLLLPTDRHLPTRREPQFPCASRGRPSERPLPLGVRHLGEAVPLTLAPPVAALAGLGPGELEALRPDDVEVDLAHHVSRRGRGLLQAAAEPAGRHIQRYLYTGRRVEKTHRHINKQVVECTDTQTHLYTGRGVHRHTDKVYTQGVE